MVCATAGSLHADRVKTLLFFGGAPSSVHRRTAIHTRQTIQGWGSRPFIFFNPVLAGHPEDIVYHYVNSGFTVADIAASSTSEPHSAQRAPNGSAPVRNFTAP